MKPWPIPVLAAMSAPDGIENGCPMSLGALSNATALTILTTAYSPSGGQTSSLSKGDSKALAADPLLASLGAPTSSADFFFVAHASQNAVMTTIVNTGLNKSNANPQALNYYEADIQQQANTYLADNEMTSQQISDALYSGQGIPVASGGGANATMADEINALTQGVAYNTQFASELATRQAAGAIDDDMAARLGLSNNSDAQVNKLIAFIQNQAAGDSALAAGITAAFQNHTLTIQKATDVQGLDYSETVWNSASGNGEGGGGSNSYSQAFLNSDADGKHHALIGIADVALYLTW
jgi:hypothetical protein